MPLSAGPVWSETALPNGLDCAAGPLRYRITALRPDIVRIRIKAAGAPWPPHLSFAVLDAARGAEAAVERRACGFATGCLSVEVERGSGRILLRDAAGAALLEDAPDRAPRLEAGGFSIAKSIRPGDRFFGLGDKTGPLARNNQAFVLWNTDPANYQESTDPIYKSIPFLVALGAPGACWALLLDNTGRTSFDFAKQHRDVLTIGAESGAADYYVIAGEHPKALLGAYGFLTGLPPLPPLWTLGHQQSRYSYMSAEAVREVARRMRAERIPNDAIYLDIDYQDRNRSFTTDPVRFPDLAGLAGELGALGTRLVAITDLQIPAAAGEDYAPYDSGLAGDHFTRDAEGRVFIGEMWGGPSAYPEFGREATRAWWGALYTGFVDAGIAGFWNDMNEPYVNDRPDQTLPLDAPHRIEEAGAAPRTLPHREMHNIYGMLNSRATFEGLTALRPHQRPFVLTRATFAGGHRYATTWTGDNSATWNHLRLGIAMLLNLGLSGFAFAGADLGGFFGSVTPDLLTRWYQLGAFTPMFRNHAFQTSAPREPWLDGEPHLSIRRRFVEERYRLLPYLYTLAEEAARTLVPMMRPLFLEFPEVVGMRPWISHDPAAQFMLGHALMIAPPLFAEFADPYEVVLPGAGWFDYWTGARVAADAAGRLRVSPTLETIPVFARAGSIVPRQNVVQSTAERPAGPLELLVFPGPDCRATVYQDAGDGFAHREGDFLRLEARCEGAGRTMRLALGPRDGRFAPWWDRATFVLHDAPAAPSGVEGEVLDMQHEAAARRLRVTVPETGAGTELVLTFPG